MCVFLNFQFNCFYSHFDLFAAFVLFKGWTFYHYSVSLYKINPIVHETCIYGIDVVDLIQFWSSFESNWIFCFVISYTVEIEFVHWWDESKWITVEEMESDLGKLFIGGISWDTDEERLKEYFSRYGEVVEAVIMRDRATGRARGFGFVVFADPAVAERVIMDKHMIDGRTVSSLLHSKYVFLIIN